MSYCQKLNMVALAGLFLLPAPLWAGDYLDSAHGSNTYGVVRPAMTEDAQTVDAPNGYARGNCAHCHEMHASLAGSEPLPGGGPSPYTLFATNFNSGTSLPGSYAVADNFCFYCHSASLLVQPVANKDYSATFGGAAEGEQSIMDAFNQPSSVPPISYHDLANIHTFAEDNFPWYSSHSNPCNACHNPHLAKKNFGSSSVFDTPLASAISRPSDHFSLWGESETMASYSYEAPCSNAATAAREPDGTVVTAGGDSSGQAAKTPDYVGFCTDCHNSTNSIPSTTLVTLRPIDWSSSGDKHGVVARDVASGATTDTSLDARNPYEAVDHSTGNFVLSCLDCHEPHGSPNIMLLRRWVNGGALNATITSTNAMGALCRQCHKDDAAAAAGTNEVGKWQYVHHYSPDAPYPWHPGPCGGCHPGKFGPINCGNCHKHGMTDPKGTGRKTF